jgi:hypothetical protein
MEVYQGPVGEPCPLHRFFTDVKAQGANEMKAAAGDSTGAGDVPGVGGNLRFYQNNVDQNGILSLSELCGIHFSAKELEIQPSIY